MKFSQRIGLTSIKKELQLEDLDNDLKNRLWNVYKTYILDRIDNKFQFTDEKQMFTRLLWHQYFKKRLDDIPKYFSISVLNIRSYYFSKTTEWYQVYDLIEVSAQIAESQPVQINTNDFFETANSVLESEFAGYRFINKMLSPITNQSEINSINDSLHKTLQFSSLKVCNIHLTESLRMLSDKQNPDYRNSIKESISAIESLTKIIAGKNSDTLGAALTKVKDKIGLHSALERGFKQLYGYTSDADGIRHGLMEESSCDFDDAKYMLVSSSAFINYLIAKANKAGINFQ